MKKIIAILIVSIMVSLLSAETIFAQEAGTLLPEPSVSYTRETCKTIIQSQYETLSTWGYKDSKGDTISNDSPRIWFANQTTELKNDILACGIITGKITFWMIPFFIVYFISFAIGISGLLAILFIVIGGFQLIFAGATDAQEKAKNTIKWALIGMGLVLSAWVLVNLIQFALTF